MVIFYSEGFVKVKKNKTKYDKHKKKNHIAI